MTAVRELADHSALGLGLMRRETRDVASVAPGRRYRLVRNLPHREMDYLDLPSHTRRAMTLRRSTTGGCRSGCSRSASAPKPLARSSRALRRYRAAGAMTLPRCQCGRKAIAIAIGAAPVYARSVISWSIGT